MIFTIGDPQKPRTIRWYTDRDYNNECEAAIEESVPTELDKTVADMILNGGGGDMRQHLERLKAWGPPEETVRAIIRAAKDAKGEAEIQKTDAWLNERAHDWNSNQTWPAAPDRKIDESRDEWLSKWRAWYNDTIQYSLGEKNADGNPKEAKNDVKK